MVNNGIVTRFAHDSNLLKIMIRACDALRVVQVQNTRNKVLAANVAHKTLAVHKRVSFCCSELEALAVSQLSATAKARKLTLRVVTANVDGSIANSGMRCRHSNGVGRNSLGHSRDGNCNRVGRNFRSRCWVIRGSRNGGCVGNGKFGRRRSRPCFFMAMLRRTGLDKGKSKILNK